MITQQLSPIEQENLELKLWRQTYEPYLKEYRDVRNKLRYIGAKINQKASGYKTNSAAHLAKDIKELLENPTAVEQND